MTGNIVHQYSQFLYDNTMTFACQTHLRPGNTVKMNTSNRRYIPQFIVCFCTKITLNKLYAKIIIEEIQR